MPPSLNSFGRRRAVLQAGLALCASALIPSARACEYFTPTLRITHPWTRATEFDAPFAVVSMRLDEVTLADRLIGVETPVASTVELIGDLRIPAGGELVLGEDGAHVRLVGLKHALEVGRAYPLVLAFEQGGLVNARLNVDYLRLNLPFQRPPIPPVNR